MVGVLQLWRAPFASLLLVDPLGLISRCWTPQERASALASGIVEVRCWLIEALKACLLACSLVIEVGP